MCRFLPNTKACFLDPSPVLEVEADKMNIAHTISLLRAHYSQHHREAVRNPWFLAWVGVVLVFIAVNGLFVVLAVRSNPGLVVENYYEQGRAYEQNAIRLLQSRDTLRWQTHLEVPESIVVGSADNYHFSAVDARGLPIAPRRVVLRAYRPADAGADFEVPLQRIAPGLFQGALVFPLPGVWDVTVEIPYDDTVYQETRRIHVQAP